jgi:hypothetical protein
MTDASNRPSQSQPPLFDEPHAVNNRTSEEADRIRKAAAVLFAELYYRQVMEARWQRAKQKGRGDKKIDDNGNTGLQ